ncbi:hypothetical protein [Sphingomonas aracearum]|uniref:Uncharacterized protein n=1 Tax=Sphingomonas aracearum TaxID=2283317 RepID=A0A369VWX8_9SPHN|nr:hypothetical protein [Sphingomonas aracearum]RDE05582.1 hypothetical protein DVW87_10135 [Sphingomonas aracearum]
MSLDSPAPSSVTPPAALSPIEARRLLQRCRDVIVAMREIGAAIGRGDVEVWAHSRVKIMDSGAEHPGNNARVRGSYWHRIEAEAFDPFWSGDVFTLKRVSGDDSYRFEQIRFDRVSLESFARQHGLDEARPASPPLRRAGRPRDNDAWFRFWCTVVSIAQDDRLNAREQRSQANLRRNIMDRMGDNPMSEETMKPVVRDLWHAVIEPAEAINTY